jgi:peptide/nickel transport system permease protein
MTHPDQRQVETPPAEPMPAASSEAARLTNPLPSPGEQMPDTAVRARTRAAMRALPLRAWLALGVLAVFLFVAVAGPWLWPYDAAATQVQNRLLAPGAERTDGSTALLGTDAVGQDVLAQVIAGSRVSMVVALATVLAAGSAGLVLGVLAGYFGGWADMLISRFGDLQLAFPSILLAILLAGALGPSITNIIIALALTRWVIFARVVRASALSVRHLDYVDSARVLGVNRRRILRRYILPACWQPLLIAATAQVGLTMVAEASLSFLGLGVPVDTPSWGTTIANGRDYLSSAWWIATAPGVALALVVVSIGVLGDTLRDKADPTTEL